MQHDYSSLVDLHNASPEIPLQVRQDFERGCAAFLVEQGADTKRAPRVATALYELMLDPRLHYHTPVHILNIFNTARDMGIALSPAETLAIWFHDAVYITGAADNEHNSQLFMRAALANLLPSDLLDRAAVIIEATAKHADADVPKEAWTVLDLDLAGLGAAAEEHARQTELVRREYPNIPAEIFAMARHDFMSRLVAKGFVYRTDRFFEREARARGNLGV